MPNLRIDIDQDRANSLGIGNNQIGQVSQAAFAGLKVTELRDGDRLIPVVIRLRGEDRNEAERIRTLYGQNVKQSSREEALCDSRSEHSESEFFSPHFYLRPGGESPPG